ncbi:MAG: double-strand break repair helicase HerA and related ATPase [Chthoniobacter sp.]|jgi:DNA helicase HerA-like ATPase|nr:double-strand break repair helicase HerA and related ATPase [Chthoniobacter sp.]
MSAKDFVSTIQAGYSFKGKAILLGAALQKGVAHAEAPVRLPLRTMNRHGLISGATGTGKTKTLAMIAEQLSEAGVPTLLMDIKGDLSGVAMPGAASASLTERHAKIGSEWSPSAYPVEFLTLLEGPGARLRATVHEFGPTLFARMLGLNETQSSLVALVFKFCDDKRLPLLDLKDFKKVLEYITGEAKAAVTAEYGLVPAASVGLILRKLIELESQGAETFFGEPSFEVEDLLRTVDEFGAISVLRLGEMQDRPKLFSTFMLQLLAELYATLPEVGDLEKPKLVLFIDEAHLIFADAEKPLLDQIETVIKLIRSKGVGVFFCTQLPTDIPDDVLGQLGMKIQHALRAFTAKDRKAIKLVAENYPETSFYNTEQMLTELGIGEAFVTVLDERGSPTALAATLLCAPRSRMGPLTAAELDGLVAASPLAERYNAAVDAQSAYEILGGKMAEAASPEHAQKMVGSARRTFSPAPAAARPPARSAELSEALGERDEPVAQVPYERPAVAAAPQHNMISDVLGSAVAKAVVRSVAVNIAGTVTRSLLGVLGVSGRRRR